ncbi:MAG: PilT/PilU family type 4a pilus ATPase [Acidimicrobiales bacterium]
MSSLGTTRPASEWSRRLVTSLTEQGLISSEAGHAALAEASGSGRPVAAVLAQHEDVDARVALDELAKLSGLDAVDIFEERPLGEALALVPEMLAREIGAVGYRLDNGALTLACCEPLPTHELRQLSEFLEREVTACVLADPSGIERIMAAVYPQRPRGPASVATGQAAAPTTQVAVSFDVYGDEPEDLRSAELAALLAAREAPRETGAGPVVPGGPAADVDLDELLTYAVENGASDLHLTNMLAPTIRVDGSLRAIEGAAPLDNEQIREMVFRVLTQNLRERFEAEKELDTSHVIFGVGRFRVNVFQQRGTIGAVFRSIPHDIPAFESLGLPEIVSSFAELRRGLVLVTGPTGSGKSTTLASLIGIINRTRPLHIMTIEDPIEFLHTHQRAIINQREVGIDTSTFAEALRHVLRQDPDVILVGEMRDVETIATALTAAETGHLVFATLHTQDAPQTIDRIIDVFPTAQQDQVRIQLAGSLEAVVTQQLIISASGLGRVAASEIMICTPAIRNLIRSAKTHQIYSLMQTGGALGMQTMDQGLARAIRAGRVTEAVAFDRCHDPAELRDHLKG